MVDVDKLTDDELRTKLVEFGFPVMPITGTTRNLMAKKLKLLIETKGKSTSDRRSLGKFSSDEESDADIKAIKKDKNRRITMAVTPMQQKASGNREEKQEMVPPSSIPIVKDKRKISGRSAKIIVQVKGSDTNSDSEPDVSLNCVEKKSYEIEVPLTKATTSSLLNKKEEEKEDSPPRVIHKTQESSYSSRITAAPLRYTTYTKPVDVNEELAKIRSRLSLNSPRTDYMMHSSLSAQKEAADLQDDDDDDDNGEEPVRFLSNFTRRLSASRNGASLGLGRAEDRDYSDTGSGLYSRTTSSNYSARPRTGYSSKAQYESSVSTTEDKPGKSSNISFILIAILALFFIVLFALYYGMHSGDMAAISGKEPSKYESKFNNL